VKEKFNTKVLKEFCGPLSNQTRSRKKIDKIN